MNLPLSNFQLTFTALFAYLPLDGSAEDFSAYHRSPNPIGDVVNVVFDGVDRKKNSAAFFNGSSYIQIKNFGQVTLGEVRLINISHRFSLTKLMA